MGSCTYGHVFQSQRRSFVRRYPCIPYSNFEFQITVRIEIGTAHIYVYIGISLHTAHIKYIMKYIYSVHQPRSFPLLALIYIAIWHRKLRRHTHMLIIGFPLDVS